MVKKLLFFIIISFFSVLTYGQQIDLSTVSKSDAWSPERVDKDGGLLRWEASGVGLSTSPLVIDANDPIFDFSSNDGSPINIVVTSADGFGGLSRLDLYTLELTSLDVAAATAFSVRY